MQPRTTCRACASPLAPVLALGPIYLPDFPRSAGTLLHPPVPLDLLRCTSPVCGLMQLAHTTPRDWLFKLYWYRSGVNETMIAELRDIVTQACRRVPLPKGTVVVDIGANDGTLLAQYPSSFQLTKVAWEPAANFYEVLRPHAQVLFPEYFHVDAAWELPLKAHLITAIAMFYDLEDPHAFLDGITRILHPDGAFIVQQAYLPAMLATNDFTNLCHEHLAYHDLRSMEALLAPHGLEVVDVEARAINGGSFRTTIMFKGHQLRPQAVEALRVKERLLFADAPALYAAFARRVAQVREHLQALLADYQRVGGAVDLYAASTKSQTLLQYCDIDARIIRQAWERSPEKVGRYVGTSAIPIVSEATGREDPPAALLVGAWSFKRAFLEREHEYLSQGGRMILPLPQVESVEYKR